ncbi:unnamed protein product [Symbiodinium pilosum]|uniref:Methyltransferase type 11 domain-containing protein n=1 Tax=Symbiodinium pilosum TaxID=2952 RepID=A0A812NJH5_SYMPI|nr:unnamed protein product [Symbiodinium pilosum]
MARWSTFGSERRRWDPTFHRIVDIGAGHGRTAAWLTQAWDFEVTAVDVVRPQSPEFNVELFDGRTLPLPDKSRDCALFSFVLHHCRHFELQRALLMEAARVSKSWVVICEDTPEETVHWKGTRGHDHLGQFHPAAEWRKMFSKIGFRILHQGPLWEGPRKGPSPYFCKRSYFILEVPAGLCAALNLCGFGWLRIFGSCAFASPQVHSHLLDFTVSLVVSCQHEGRPQTKSAACQMTNAKECLMSSFCIAFLRLFFSLAQDCLTRPSSKIPLELSLRSN